MYGVYLAQPNGGIACFMVKMKAPTPPLLRTEATVSKVEKVGDVVFIDVFGTIPSGKHKRVDPFAAGLLSCYATAISL
jgi:hypothetical protein